jgi:hypothetical protein
MTQPATDSTTVGPTYADAVERVSAALMFREPTLARTSKTARLIATRAVDALVNAQVTVESVTIPVVAQQTTIDETN